MFFHMSRGWFYSYPSTWQIADLLPTPLLASLETTAALRVLNEVQGSEIMSLLLCWQYYRKRPRDEQHHDEETLNPSVENGGVIWSTIGHHEDD